MEGILTKETLDDHRYSVLIDPCEGSEVVVVVFGGIVHKLPIPVFEFMRSLDQFHVNKVFIRDFKQCWYTNGIENVTANVSETTAYLRQVVNRLGARKSIFIGNSAGAYASLLYGHLVQVDEVHAFSPQIFIDRWNRFLIWDRRWSKEISRLNKEAHDYFDLRNIFRKSSNTKTKYHLYWDAQHRLDNIHCLRLKFKNVVHHKFNGGGHEVIKQMKKRGELDVLLKAIVTVEEKI